MGATNRNKRKSPPRKSGARSGNGPAKSPRPSAISNYSGALRWLYEQTDYERMRLIRYNTTTFSLERMRRLLRAIGNPEKQLRCVHIAGTKGKGSTAAMLDAILRGCGYTVGLYTSPHLTDLRERIQVNGAMIGQSDLTELIKLIKSKARAMSPDTASFFDVMTACALQHIADQAVDVAVIETGLGGRLDSTNVISPLVCGLTHISHDHTNVLGKEITSIAAEKAGILKRNVPAVSVAQDPPVERVLRQAAEDVAAPLQFTGRDIEFSYRFESTRELGHHFRVGLATANGHFDHLPVPLNGEHQAYNCGLALALADKLRAKDFDLPEEKIISGLAGTKLSGRMEMVWSEPRIMLDGAHNGVSIRALVKAIGAHVPYDSLVMIFGCAADKDVVGMLKEVNLGADKVIFTRARSNPRASEPDDLLALFNELSGKMAQAAPNLAEALNLAQRAVGRDDLICITGSFHLVGEAKKYLTERAATQQRPATVEAV